MPFWWYRRRKPWFGRYRRRRNTYRRKATRRRNRRPRRYRNRRTYRRRRRRHRKVRRKNKKITVKIWQPESIRKCKIKGTGIIVLGAQGTQFRCYTTYKDEWTNPKRPAGGGFGCELFSLKYLYNEYKYKNNIWTTSNANYDLVRYTGCSFTFYRHPETDFILIYDIQPPFDLTKYTFMACHPHLLLQRKHKKILLSTATKPTGRLTKKFKIKPPKMLSTKWLFQEDFSQQGLVTIIASACNFRYPDLGCCNENLLITIYFLQPFFYKDSKWAQNTGESPYLPYSTVPKDYTFIYDTDRQKDQQYTMNPNNLKDYDTSVSYEVGWFQTKVLSAKQVKKGQQVIDTTPCGVLRYNPHTDSGKGNKMWLTSIVTGQYNVPRDEDLIMENYPLWLMLYGYTSFLREKKHDQSYFNAYLLVIQSDSLYRVSGHSTTAWYPIIDKNFVKGKLPGGEQPTFKTTHQWYPSLKTQLETINEIVNTGPYIPKYNETKNSTWQCNYHYNFYFKWGGSQQPEALATDPASKGKYPVLDPEQEGLQIEDPDKQKVASILKTWDYRRGQITNKALKRMYDNLETESSLSTDSSCCSSPKKKKVLPKLHNPKKESKKIKTCLQELCKESISPQEEEDPNILQLIQQQHQQQQQLKHNLLTLITDLKTKQRTMLHQQGLLF
nr:MAG: ORF1 [Torque teno midi virus]